MNSRTLSLLLVTALTALTPGRILATDCECSCDALTEFKARVTLFEHELDQGLNATMSPALQSQLACLNPCAEDWMQCRALTLDGIENTPAVVNNGSPGIKMQISHSDEGTAID